MKKVFYNLFRSLDYLATPGLLGLYGLFSHGRLSPERQTRCPGCQNGKGFESANFKSAVGCSSSWRARGSTVYFGVFGKWTDRFDSFRTSNGYNKDMVTFLHVCLFNTSLIGFLVDCLNHRFSSCHVADFRSITCG